MIGSGVSGMAAAWALADSKLENKVTLYEKDHRIGGHTNTIEIDKVGPVDTGFIVFNPETYPNLINFFKHNGVKYEGSDMSFAVSIDDGKFEWAGEGLHTIFAQKKNLINPGFLRMLYDMARFNREAIKFLSEIDEKKLTMTLGTFLEQNGYSMAFRELYLYPMTGCVWSTPASEIADFPAVTLFRFCHNHKMLQVFERPQWLTVSKGSREYIKVIKERVKDIRLSTGVVAVKRNDADSTVSVTDCRGKTEIYDHVIFACHGDQTFEMLKDKTVEEERILGRIEYKKNRAVVHRDASLMPKLRVTWSSWNYQTLTRAKDTHVSLTYWMNRLQPFLPRDDNIFVTLNPLKEPKKETVISEVEYEHPVYTIETIRTQRELDLIQGKRNTWYAGAWTNFGFHEDGFTSGLKIGQRLGAQFPFPVIDATHIRPLSKL